MDKDNKTVTLGTALNMMQRAIVKEVLNHVYVFNEPDTTHKNVLRLIEQTPEPNEKDARISD